ncbi:hypothetical protein HHK36_006512 [Tetracentron sinense]|uniref:Uncharacterized protein n=1 Tax=Tetracentron sinense TaxID=13715 RepID=A0A834ZI57_TETSI|nr:hypothetical protein HHK36_006512 [Tetracentron sinense]
MSILNQSITPHGHGQPTNTQDIFQQLPVPQLLRNRSLNSSQWTPLKKITGSSAQGGANEQHSITGSVAKFSKLLGPITWPMEPFTLSFLPTTTTTTTLMDNEKFNAIEEPRLLYLEPPRATTLVVAVSSAVKLQHKQLDQIARKMKRVTGFTSVKLENTVDPSLIAGFIISYEEEEGPHVIDLSVKGQLAELAARIQSAD